MQYLAYIALAFLGMQFVNVLLNMLFRQKMKRASTPQSAFVSILIPARNEEHNIGFLLSDLQKTKSIHLEVIVFDDESTDATAQVVADFVQTDKRFKLIRSEGLPEGWLGKNHACYRLAQQAQGNYFLFIDADVRISGNVLERAVAYMQNKKLKLLSVFPTQTLKSFGERISVPIMNYILLTLLPLILVRKSPFGSHSAANGQFMLFEAATYMTVDVHQRFRNSPAEDIVVARYFKKCRLQVACVTGEKQIECRMYQSLREAVNGFSKNVFMFFGNHAFLGFVFWLFAALGFVPVSFAMPFMLPFYFAVLLLTLILFSLLSRQNVFDNTLLFPLQLLFLLHIMLKAFLNKNLKNIEWKGRKIYS